MNKPPCADCKNHKYYGYSYPNDRITGHYCMTNKRSVISGNIIEHGCWWWRFTPLCKFEEK